MRSINAVFTLLLLCSMILPAGLGSVYAESSEAQFSTVKNWGSTGDEVALGLAQDVGGNYYANGYFQNTVDFDPGVGTNNIATGGGINGYISKFDSNNQYQWTKIISSATTTVIEKTAISESGEVFLTGYFRGTADLDPGAGVDSKTANGADAFLIKLDAQGEYMWSLIFTGAGDDAARTALIEKGTNNIFVGLYFASTIDLDPSGGTDSRTSAGSWDSALVKLDASGAYQWGKTLGSIGSDDISWLGALRGDTVSMLGGTTSASLDLDPGAGTVLHTNAGSADGIFVELDVDTGNYVSSRVVASTAVDYYHTYEVDTEGNQYLCGRFSSSADMDPGNGTDQHTSNGDADGFVTKFNATGDYLWTKSWGGTGLDLCYGSKIDEEGNVYAISGWRNTVDFDTGTGVDERTSAGGYDMALIKLNSTGAYQWAQTLGSTGDDVLRSFLAGTENVRIFGNSNSAVVDFDPGVGSAEYTGAGGYDSFLLEFSQSYTQHVVTNPDISAVDAGTGVSLEAGNEGIPRGSTATVRLLRYGLPVAEAEATFMSDLNWASVTGDVNEAAYKSVIADLAGAEGVASTHTLFVPKAASHDRVIICPSVESLSAVTISCANRRVETVDSAGVSVVTIGGKSYWKVSGLNGTGGISATAAEVPGVPNTGAQRVVLKNPFVILGFTAVTAGLLVWVRRKV